jgi:hypothetical protein
MCHFEKEFKMIHSSIVKDYWRIDLGEDLLYRGSKCRNPESNLGSFKLQSNFSQTQLSPLNGCEWSGFSTSALGSQEMNSRSEPANSIEKHSEDMNI